MSSYWLSEPSPPLPKNRVDDPEVVVVGGGVTGCAAALRLAQAGKRVRLYDGRGVAEGASGRNGGFALRGMPAAFDVTAESVGEAARQRADGVDGERDRHDRVARRRLLPARRLAPDRGRRRGAGRAAHRVRGARRRRLRGRVDRPLRAAARGSLHRGAPSRSRRRPPAGALGAATGGARSRGRGGDPRARARRVPRRARRRHRRRLHRRVPERPARADRGADHPDARTGDRDGARSRAPLRGPALRSPRLRLLAPVRGREDRRRAASATCRSTRSSPPTRS